MPQHIGLIGGIGPAATDYYYRRLISRYADETEQLEATIVHADTATLLHNLETDRPQSQVEIYEKLTFRLASAGANCVAVTSIAGHFCIDAFKKISSLPVIDMLEVIGKVVGERALGKVGILGTRSVMESRFYASLDSTEIVIPPSNVIKEVHQAYVSMAASGQVSDSERSIFDSTCQWFVDHENVDAILLGGTDLVLLYDETTTRFPIVDCAAIHADAIFSNSMSSR